MMKIVLVFAFVACLFVAASARDLQTFNGKYVPKLGHGKFAPAVESHLQKLKAHDAKYMKHMRSGLTHKNLAPAAESHLQQWQAHRGEIMSSWMGLMKKQEEMFKNWTASWEKKLHHY